MRVAIKECVELDGATRVLASSASGEFRALCSSRNVSSLVGSDAVIELDVNESIAIGKNAFHEQKLDNGFYDDGLVCTVEDQDDDGMAYCRISPDCLLMIESEDVIPKETKIKMQMPEESLEMTLI